MTVFPWHTRRQSDSGVARLTFRPVSGLRSFRSSAPNGYTPVSFVSQHLVSRVARPRSIGTGDTLRIQPDRDSPLTIARGVHREYPANDCGLLGIDRRLRPQEPRAVRTCRPGSNPQSEHCCSRTLGHQWCSRFNTRPSWPLWTFFPRSTMYCSSMMPCIAIRGRALPCDESRLE